MELQTFPKFGELPLIIRWIIVGHSLDLESRLLLTSVQWQHALAFPRIVELEATENPCSFVILKKGLSYRSKHSFLRDTCRGSREEALRFYSLEKPRNEANSVISSPRIHFNYDIVHFKDLHFAWRYGGYMRRA